jgi:hypothetical protein
MTTEARIAPGRLKDIELLVTDAVELRARQ